jgi:hypothetical protein
VVVLPPRSPVRSEEDDAAPTTAGPGVTLLRAHRGD